MGLEKRVAWATLFGPSTLALTMWGIAGTGFVWPPVAIYGAIILGGFGLAVTAGLWCHIGWVWVRAKGLQLGPAIVIAISMVGLIGGGIWGVATWSPTTKTSPQPAQKKKDVAQAQPKIPSLATLFMTDFQGKSAGVGVQMNGVADLTIGENEKLRIFYNVNQDFSSHSKFISFYIPASSHTFSAISFLASGYKQYLNTRLQAEVGGSGVLNITKSGDLVFTGRIYIYYETPLSLEQLGALDAEYKTNNLSPEFRTTAYALAVLSSIRAGDIKPPPQYELRDNLLQLIPGEKTQP
jgi:hypothetical protein